MNLLRQMPLGTQIITHTYADAEFPVFGDYGRLLKKHHNFLIRKYRNDNLFKMAHRFVVFKRASDSDKIDAVLENFKANFNSIYFFTHWENVMHREAEPIFEYVPFSYGGDYVSMLKFTSAYELMLREEKVFFDGTTRENHWTEGLLIKFVHSVCLRAGLHLESIEI